MFDQGKSAGGASSRKFLFYLRLTPDRRLLFGGRTSFARIDDDEACGILAASMREVFPKLADCAVDYSWNRNVGSTFDQLPHIGEHEGMHFAMGYCGHGVANSLYFGHHLANLMRGQHSTLPFAELPSLAEELQPRGQFYCCARLQPHVSWAIMKYARMRRFRRVATVLNLVVVASIATGSFSMCLEDGTNAARAMACCKAHGNCPDSTMARDCCKHERAKDAITQAAAVKSDAAAAVPLPTAVALPVAVVWSAAYAVTPISAPVAAESPPIFVVQHTFRI